MIRVGAVNYLNSKPLIEGLEGFAPNIRLTLDLPSRLADQMERGELDVGLLPVAEVFRGGYAFLPNIAIASRGPVLSVTLFSKVPWNEIRSVALDEGSRTSAMLTKILMANRDAELQSPLHPLLTPLGATSPSGGEVKRVSFLTSPPEGEVAAQRRVGGSSSAVRYEQLSIDAPAEDANTDAVLLIGDRAMKACLPRFPHSYDLGQLWNELTELPMVYAVWAVRPGVKLGVAETAFGQAKRFGLSRAGIIAAREAAILRLDAGYCRRYFDTIIQYDLGLRELAGMNRFRELAADLGLAPQGECLDYCHRSHLVESR